ncbi:MAG TPA: energy transducer TonB [Candidatus Eisenbacteria bacterium]|nr:energy transducer TonB [Candidatus Eisenbacteria bacterium]
MTVHLDSCRVWKLLRMLRLRSHLLVLVLAAIAGCGTVRATSDGPHDSGTKLLDLELTRRLMHLDNVQVFRVEEAPAERCDAAETVGTDEVRCHRILDSGSAPTIGWARIMTSLIVWNSEFRDEGLREFREPSHAIRYHSSSGRAEVLLSLRHQWLAVVSDDLPPAIGSFGKSYEQVLLLLAEVMPEDPELRDLIGLEEIMRMDAVRAGLPSEPQALWADCPPPPVGPMDYDDPPVTAEAPPPDYPEGAKGLGIQGTVVLHVFVEDDGVPCWVKVVSGNRILADAAVEAMRSWRFHPAEKGGNRVGAWMKVPVEFTIQERDFRIPK